MKKNIHLLPRDFPNSSLFHINPFSTCLRITISAGLPLKRDTDDDSNRENNEQKANERKNHCCESISQFENIVQMLN